MIHTIHIICVNSLFDERNYHSIQTRTKLIEDPLAPPRVLSSEDCEKLLLEEAFRTVERRNATGDQKAPSLVRKIKRKQQTNDSSSIDADYNENDVGDDRDENAANYKDSDDKNDT